MTILFSPTTNIQSPSTPHPTVFASCPPTHRYVYCVQFYMKNSFRPAETHPKRLPRLFATPSGNRFVNNHMNYLVGVSAEETDLLLFDIYALVI